MVRVVLFFALVLIHCNVFATAQAPDWLIYKGKKYALHVNPLEELFLKNEDLLPETNVISSGNWRGYTATFKIVRNKLYVTKITVKKYNQEDDYFYQETVTKTVFPKKTDRRMDWYSGLLVIPKGEELAYVHQGYSSIYEKYLLIKISEGKIKETVEMTDQEYLSYKIRQFEEYKKTPEYLQVLNELTEDSKPDDDFDNEGFIFRIGEFTQKIDIPFKSE